jgi:hypothetical protein
MRDFVYRAALGFPAAGNVFRLVQSFANVIRRVDRVRCSAAEPKL